MPILSSFGTANDRAYGFGNSDFLGATELPLIITNNAQIIYDASNPDSYSGSGSTWYDISGNNRHATLNGTPALAGTGANQYFTFTNTNSLTVPRAVDYNWNFFFIGDVLGAGTISSTFWQSDSFLQDGAFNFEGINIGGGSGIRNNGGYSNGLKLWHGEFSGTNSSLACTTRQGGSNGYYVQSRSAFGTRDYDINSSMTVTGGTIKFMAIYGTTSPTTEQVYNALKGRFGL